MAWASGGFDVCRVWAINRGWFFFSPLFPVIWPLVITILLLLFCVIWKNLEGRGQRSTECTEWPTDKEPRALRLMWLEGHVWTFTCAPELHSALLFKLYKTVLGLNVFLAVMWRLASFVIFFVSSMVDIKFKNISWQKKWLRYNYKVVRLYRAGHYLSAIIRECEVIHNNKIKSQLVHSDKNVSRTNSKQREMNVIVCCLVLNMRLHDWEKTVTPFKSLPEIRLYVLIVFLFLFPRCIFLSLFVSL